jgi:hypothetical protein
MTTQCIGLTWNANLTLFIGVGSGTNAIVTTPDGVTYTGRTGTSIFSGNGQQVATNSSGTNAGVIVATGTGTNTLAYSYDGINWTGLGTTIISTSAYGIAWNSTTGQWVAGGTTTANLMANSPDGVNWTTRTPFTTGCYSLAFQGPKERTYTISNTQWTGRTSQQTFRILG